MNLATEKPGDWGLFTPVIVRANLTISHDELAILLKQAADAHHVYEHGLNVDRIARNEHPITDANWPTWYADYIIRNAR